VPAREAGATPQLDSQCECYLGGRRTSLEPEKRAGAAGKGFGGFRRRTVEGMSLVEAHVELSGRLTKET